MIIVFIVCVLFFTFTICVSCIISFVLSDFFFFKQKTAYDMRISDWSSDVCSSDLLGAAGLLGADPQLDHLSVSAREGSARRGAAGGGARRRNRARESAPRPADARRDPLRNAARGDRADVRRRVGDPRAAGQDELHPKGRWRRPPAGPRRSRQLIGLPVSDRHVPTGPPIHLLMLYWACNTAPSMTWFRNPDGPDPTLSLAPAGPCPALSPPPPPPRSPERRARNTCTEPV